MNDPEQRLKWRPSDRQMAFDWYLRQSMRVVGAGVIAWELGVDNGKNLAIFLGGVMLASAMNALDLLRGLVAQAKAERVSMRDLLEQELRREQEEAEGERS